MHRGMAQDQQDIVHQAPRAYLCGCKNEGEKPKHIVEVTEKMSIQYVKVIDIIKAALEKDGITKEDARKMRVELCKKYP